MKQRKMLSWIVAGSLLVSPMLPVGTVQAESVSEAEVINSVNFRTAPSLEGERIRYLREGEEIEILDKVNPYWYKIKDQNGRIGFVTTIDRYIHVLPEETDDVHFDANGVVTWGVSFRTGPSTDYDRMRYLHKGEEIMILDQVNAYWYKVMDRDGTVGYSSAKPKFIDTDYNESADGQEEDGSGGGNDSAHADFVPNGVVTWGVSFRTGPSTDYDRMRYLHKGEEIMILDQVNAYWYKVMDQDGTVGYSSAKPKFIDTDYNESADGQEEDGSGGGNDSAHADFVPNGVVTWGVSFRTGPSTDYDRMRYLHKGEEIMILDQVNAYWYKVMDRDGTVGYSSAKPKFIDTDYNESADGQEEETSGGGNDSAHADFVPNGVVTWGVSFRTGPSTDYDRMRYLHKGEEIMILDQVNAYWYKVMDQDGTVGYSSAKPKFIDTDYNESAGGQEEDGSGNTDESQTDISVLAQKVINAGKAYLGTPYEYGSSRYNTETFDCSDFVRQAFLDGIDLSLPFDSRSQAKYVKEKGDFSTNWDNLEPGDLLFFIDYMGTDAEDYEGAGRSIEDISHVGIYLGNGKMINTRSKRSGGVRVDSLDGTYWEYRFLFGGSAMRLA